MSLIFCHCRELLTYTDSSKPLAETDLDNIVKCKPTNNVEPVNAPNMKNEEIFSTKQLESTDDGGRLETDNNEKAGEEVGSPQDESVRGSGPSSQDSQTALKLSLTLPASCYATMAIRELLKTSTSVSNLLENSYTFYGGQSK